MSFSIMTIICRLLVTDLDGETVGAEYHAQASSLVLIGSFPERAVLGDNQRIEARLLGTPLS